MRFLNLRIALALGAIFMALLLPRLPLPSPPGRPIDTRSWTLSDFAEHLRRCGLQLHVVPGMGDGSHGNGVYLTEDPDATWHTMQRKPRVVERIREWRGTVLVWYVLAGSEEPVAEWGPYSCRIGRFLLFGDETILRRIEDACRSEDGRWGPYRRVSPRRLGYRTDPKAAAVTPNRSPHNQPT